MNVVTLCEHGDGAAHPREPDEVAAIHWLSPDEIRDHPDAPAFLERDVERIEALRDRRGRAPIREAETDHARPYQSRPMSTLGRSRFTPIVPNPTEPRAPG